MSLSLKIGGPDSNIDNERGLQSKLLEKRI